MEQELQAQRSDCEGSRHTNGCIVIPALILVLCIISSVTFVYQIVMSTIEQSVFMAELTSPDLRWLATIGYGLIILLPSLVTLFFCRDNRWRNIFSALGLAGAFPLFQLAPKLVFITNAQAANLFQILGLFGFLVITLLTIRKKIKSLWVQRSMTSLWVGMITGLITYIPWMIWGSFGSLMDVVLNLTIAALYGLGIGLALSGTLFYKDPIDAVPSSFGMFLLDGFIAGAILVTTSTALGANGNSWLLFFGIGGLGWAAAGINRAGNNRGWLGVVIFLLLAAAGPLLRFDPDELMIILGLEGESLQWAALASIVALLIGWVTSLVWLVTWKWGQLIHRPGIWAAISGIFFILLGILSLLTGKTGFYGERLFVILKDQADVSRANTIGNYNQRRNEVYTILTRHADLTQAEIRNTLDALHINYQPYYLVNAIEIDGGPLIRLWLMTRPEVDRILDSPHLRPLPVQPSSSRGEESAPASKPWNISLIRADQVWSQIKVTGEGIVVGQSDSGVDGNHPEIAAQFRGANGSPDYNWYDPWNHSKMPVDIGGHGTHTTGSILGKNVGVAPGATWIGCVNLARNLGNPAYYLDCMQFNLAPFPQNGNPFKDGRPELGAHVLNNSWGCPAVEGCDAGVYRAAMSALKAAGVFVVASAGNDGDLGCSSVRDPIAIYADAYSVGAVDRHLVITSFSSRGPVKVDGSNRIKPDISAPGSGILSAYPGGTYSVASGTSMAGPHVVGVVALMWSANPKLIGEIDLTREILNQTAQKGSTSANQCGETGQQNNVYGYGIVDAYAAVKRALEVKK
ncbi:MAG TPA: S8 family serine peptidase [Anaerolineaceae bacterium]